MLEKLKNEIELVTRHIEVLAAVARYQPIGIIKLAELLEQPQHRIRYSLRVLENQGFIRASSVGAVVTEQAENLFLHLDDDIEEIIRLFLEMKVHGTGASVVRSTGENQHF